MIVGMYMMSIIKNNNRGIIVLLYTTKKLDVERVRDFYCSFATWSVNDSLNHWEELLKNSTCVVSVWEKDELIGMARSLSDQIRWANILDLLVHPDYRNQSIGSFIISKLLEQKEMQVKSVYLATQTQEEFYNKFGFDKANDDYSYMVKVNKSKYKYFLPVKE